MILLLLLPLIIHHIHVLTDSLRHLAIPSPVTARVTPPTL